VSNSSAMNASPFSTAAREPADVQRCIVGRSPFGRYSLLKQRTTSGTFAHFTFKANKIPLPEAMPIRTQRP